MPGPGRPAGKYVALSVTPPPALMSTTWVAGALPCACAASGSIDASENMTKRERRIEFSQQERVPQRHDEQVTGAEPHYLARTPGVDAIGTRRGRAG